MKKYIYIVMLVVLASVSFDGKAQVYEWCGICGGSCYIMDSSTSLRRACPQCGDPCAACGGFGIIMYYGYTAGCIQCGGSGRARSGGSNISFRGKTTVFVKTNAKCGTCSCLGYSGYKHQNGTYEGACQSKDNWGHTCGHSPSQHGLKQW